ncbi:hypothetical protein BDR26DRAFT_1016219 [Obelidium mucronatum]|nr:hypothetical protein BDR26DRAFT_1016219 [Obelidium mucronatum]
MNFALPPDAPAADRIHAPLPLCWFRNVLGIYLDNNAFYGPIPVELCVSIGPHCRMTTSRIISMSGNQLTGPIPPELGGYSHTLYTLDLSNNKLEGCIPPELVNLTGLRNLDLSDNRLEGSIPEQFFGSLFELHLARNRLSGPLSSTRVFPDLNPSLRVLDLSGNDLEGDVPGWLGCLWKLQCLDLSDNHFSGLIPEELSKDLRYISEINLARNQLHGTVPLSLDNLADHLLIFDVSCNNIGGELPTCMQIAMVKIFDWRFERDWAGYFASWLFTDDCEDSSLHKF